jgi:hypothetical protein
MPTSRQFAHRREVRPGRQVMRNGWKIENAGGEHEVIKLIQFRLGDLIDGSNLSATNAAKCRGTKQFWIT